MPRLFTGLEVPPEAAMALAGLSGGLRKARWIDSANYHVTLRFIGDIDGFIADEIAENLARIERPPFALRIAGLGAFGGRKPHALVAVVDPDPALLDLYADHERAVQRAGLVPEGRKYAPHVTLARLRGVNAAETADWLAMRGATFRPLAFPVSRFVLFSARASTGGGPYVVEEDYDLVGR